MNDKKDNKKKSDRVGFYIALCCCIAAIGTVGFINTRKSEKQAAALPKTEFFSSEKENSLPTLPPAKTPPVAEVSKTVTTEAPKIEESTVKPIPTETENPDVDVIEIGESTEFYDGETVESVSIAKQPKFLLPANGEICCGFSGDTLCYDSVMEDFRTHNGVDIVAAADSDVIASADGIIEEVYDGNLGKTVTINHSNGFKTLYANLDDIENIQIGTEIKKGDFLAHVGTYAFGENTTEPHIHFEILRDGEYVNPEDFLD